MANGTTTTTMPSYMNDSLGSLSNSLGSLSNPSSRAQASQIAKTYRQAGQLFLTRRLPEALSTIEPIITPESVEQNDGHHSHTNGTTVGSAPIASASRGARIKVWGFYLTFLNAVVELGPEEGKQAFGSTKWKYLVNKARDGTVWEDIVQVGYHGIEGNVDGDVVINLATLLLTHSPSQKLNQNRLETYLSAISHPSFDITSALTTPRLRRTHSAASGTNTPRDLHTNLKLLELYTLHVLPRNQEWDYAREFIMMSEVLDDERKEGFLQALHGLREEQEETAIKEREIQKQQQEQMEQQRRKEEEIRQAELRRVDDEASRRKEESKRQQQQQQKPPDPSSPSSSKSGRNGPGTSRKIPVPKKDVTRRPPPASFYKRAAGMIAALQTLLLNTAQSLSNNPMALMRAVLFLLMFALAFGKQEVRERVRRMLRQIWAKISGTVGMGVKVSYI
ncbi:hypothetical protein EJ08DRAFT_605971 [Tothia fuscella]|uniref:Peroxin 26 n=1 Tax=Tothia fuscella TaxID=1048955 RepID=A0A9P4NZM1_9PEZI|nr:hypothetical protein EJ08DRAFT_605971 [Tothia fuscella]